MEEVQHACGYLIVHIDLLPWLKFVTSFPSVRHSHEGSHHGLLPKQPLKSVRVHIARALHYHASRRALQKDKRPWPVKEEILLALSWS